MSNIQSSTDKAAALPPPQILSKEEEEEEYRMQLMILDQQNKGLPGYAPAITDAAKRPRQQDGTIKNLLVDGEGLLICDSCVDKTYSSDRLLWPDLKQHVHRAIPVEWRTGPDMHQCFCGYFSFRSGDLPSHIEKSKLGQAGRRQDDEVMAVLVDRIGQVGMHRECQNKLVAFITRDA